MAKKPWEEVASPTPTAAGPGQPPWQEAASAPRSDPTLLTSQTASSPHTSQSHNWTGDRQSEMQEGQHPLWDKVTAYQEPDFHHPLDAAATTFQNVGGQFVKGVGDMFLPNGTLSSAVKAIAHPKDSAKSLVESISGQPYDPSNDNIWPDPRGALKTGVQMAGQGAALVPMAEQVGPLTSAVGKGIKGAGRIAGEMTLGTDAVDRANGVRPGAGISENRVVAATRPSLQQKVASKIGGLKAQQADVLANSPSAQGKTIPTRDIVNEPFLDTMGRTTNYRTGMGAPAEMGAHYRAMESMNYAQDPRGGILRDPVSQQPIPAGIDSHSPIEAANFASNLYRATNYDTPESSLANQDLKLAGGRLSSAIKNAVPESAEITDRLSNTEEAKDILARQRGARLSVPTSRKTLTGMLVDNIADPARVLIGSGAAAGLDLLGSGVKRVGDALTPNSGGGQQPNAATQPAPAPQPPTITGQLNAPPAPLPQGQGALNAGHVVTPAPQPVAGALPGSAAGPLTRVVTRVPTAKGGSTFGPRVEAPAFNRRVGYNTSIMREGAEAENAANNQSRGPSITERLKSEEGSKSLEEDFPGMEAAINLRRNMGWDDDKIRQDLIDYINQPPPSLRNSGKQSVLTDKVREMMGDDYINKLNDLTDKNAQESLLKRQQEHADMQKKYFQHVKPKGPKQ